MEKMKPVSQTLILFKKNGKTCRVDSNMKLRDFPLQSMLGVGWK